MKALRNLIPLCLLVLCGLAAGAQTTIPTFQYVSVAPSGACVGTPPIQVIYATGVAWSCNSGFWGLFGGGGGGGGSGTVNNANAYQIGSYPTAGNTIGGAPNVYVLSPSMTVTQINTLFSGLTAGQDVVFIPPSIGQIGFSNPNHINTFDQRNGAALVQLGGEGISCDEQQTGVTLTQGSNLANVGGLAGAANDVGKIMTFSIRTGLGYQSPQYSWIATITAYNNPNFTLSAPAPFNFAALAQLGTDNSNAAQSALDNWGYAFPLSIPTGCKILLSRPLHWNKAQSLVGMQMASSGFVGAPGKDILQQPDSAGLGSANGNGVRVENLDFDLDSGIDPTQPNWTAYDSTGAGTVQPVMYRPLHDHMQDANNPCANGWIQGCTNGVAQITQNSNVICVPTALGRVPQNGRTIMFPYFQSIFTATVTSNTGACPSGFTGSTMNTAFPNSSPYSTAQAEWFSGTAIQSTTTTIPTSITYPLTLTLTLPIQPDYTSQSNFATHGTLKVCGIEAEYMGVNNYSSNVVTLRRGPASSNGCTGTTPIAPVNACPAKNLIGSSTDQPWPVIPSINAGDSTPSGANWFPGLCGGAAAISFPQANGNVLAQAGLVNAFLENLQYDAVSGSNNTNSTQAIYMAGNTASYGTDIGGQKVDFLEYGISQGPASSGQHGVALVGPTGQGNRIHNISIRAAYPLSLVDNQGTNFVGLDFYSTLVSPFDGTNVGVATCGSVGYTLDEQTGNVVSNTSNDHFDTVSCEPENGSHIEVPVYWESDCASCNYTRTNFEGGFVEFGGEAQTVEASSGTVPWIDYGIGNHYKELSGIPSNYITNTWSNTFINWGRNPDCSMLASGFGPAVACGAGFSQPYSGHSIEAAQNGNFAHPEINALGGVIAQSEWNLSSLDSSPFQVNSVPDTTEPYWGKYTGCNLGNGGQCGISHFDGGAIYIGPNQRIVDGAYTLETNLKTATGSSTISLFVNAADSGSGTCASPGNVGAATVNTTTSWQHYSVPMNFTGKAGCVVVAFFFNGTTVDQLRVGEYDFVPIPGRVLLPTLSPTLGANCLGPNAIIGANAQGPMSCFNGVVIQATGAVQSLTTSGTSGPSTLISGVLNIPQYTGGGSSGFPITLGSTSVAAGSTTTSVAGLTLTTSTINGVTPATGGSSTLFLNQAGGYTAPVGTGTITVCSGTISLGTATIASTASTNLTATCTGLLSTDNIQVDFNGSPLAVVGYMPSTSGTLTIIKWPSTNTLNLAVINNTAASITPGAITLNFRATR